MLRDVEEVMNAKKPTLASTRLRCAFSRYSSSHFTGGARSRFRLRSDPNCASLCPASGGPTVTWTTLSCEAKGPRWTEHHGILWFRADTKWSTKKTYYKVLRVLLPLDREVKLFIDDFAPGHGGACPEHFLRSIDSSTDSPKRGTRNAIRRPSSHQLQAQSLRTSIRKSAIRDLLRKEFKKTPSSLKRRTSGCLRAAKCGADKVSRK